MKGTLPANVCLRSVRAGAAAALTLSFHWSGAAQLGPSHFVFFFFFFYDV